MSHFIFLVKEIFNGKSVIRSFLNYHLKQELLEGKVLDLGSGKDDLYSKVVPQKKGTEYKLSDVKTGENVNFESDRLPYEDHTFDTILLLNVLEHIYNYKHLLTEIKRIKKDGGTLIGFVPFLMWYHADHSDFFRYTHEALEKILIETGYRNISVVNIYYGPYISAFSMINLTIPRILRPLFFSLAYTLDYIYRWLKPKKAESYALGYHFTAK